MVKIRSFSATDECFQSRKNTLRILSPRSPLLSPKPLKTPKTPTSATKFDFAKIKPPIKKQRSVSLSSELEKVISFKRHCRKYTINTEISLQLAKIGDEISIDYAHIFQNFDMATIRLMFEGSRRRNRNATTNTTSRKRKISGYLGQMLLYLASSI